MVAFLCFLGAATCYIVGMEKSDSDSLLDALWAHATRQNIAGTMNSKKVISLCGKTAW